LLKAKLLLKTSTSYTIGAGQAIDYKSGFGRNFFDTFLS